MNNNDDIKMYKQLFAISSNKDAKLFFQQNYDWCDFFKYSCIKAPTNFHKEIAQIFSSHLPIEKFINIEELNEKLSTIDFYDIPLYYSWITNIPQIYTYISEQNINNIANAALTYCDHDMLFQVLLNEHPYINFSNEQLFNELYRLSEDSQMISLTYLDWAIEKFLPHFSKIEQEQFLLNLFVISAVKIKETAALHTQIELDLMGMTTPPKIYMTHDEAIRSVQFLQNKIYWNIWSDENKSILVETSKNFTEVPDFHLINNEIYPKIQTLLNYQHYEQLLNKKENGHIKKIKV